MCSFLCARLSCSKEAELRVRREDEQERREGREREGGSQGTVVVEEGREGSEAVKCGYRRENYHAEEELEDKKRK